MTTTPTATISTDIAELGGVTGASVLHEALSKIAAAEIVVFDEDEQCNVIAPMDADEMAEIARSALKSAAPALPEPAAAQERGLIIASGYEGGTLAFDPTQLGATINLHYESPAEAEQAFGAITEIIDAANKSPQPLAEVSAAQAVPAGDCSPLQFLHNVCADVLLALHNCDRQPLGSLLDAALKQLPVSPAAQAVPEAPTKECWSSDQENFNCESLAELIDHAGDLMPGQTVWVGEAVRPEPSELFNAEWAMEQMGEQAHDFAGEHADDYPDVSPAEQAELQALIEGWISKYAQPNFWKVENVKPYLLSHDDFPNDPTPVQCDIDAAPVAQPTDTTKEA